MSTIQLPQFKSHPECSVGLLTLDDAWFLMTQGWLTVEGAQYLLPTKAWDLLPQKTSSHIQAKAA